MATVWFAAPGESVVGLHYLGGAIFGKLIASPMPRAANIDLTPAGRAASHDEIATHMAHAC